MKEPYRCEKHQLPMGTSYCNLCAVEYERKEVSRLLCEGAAKMHKSAPEGYKCADCELDQEACPTCYAAWWKEKHPDTVLVESVSEEQCPECGQMNCDGEGNYRV